MKAPEIPASTRRWVALALTGALLALAAGGVLVILTFDDATLEALGRLRPDIALVLAALMLGNWLSAAGRIHLLTRSLGHRLRFRQSLQVAVCGEFGVSASPAGLGGTALRLGVLRARGVPLTQGTAVVGADFILDSGVALLVTVLALPLAFLAPGSRPMAEQIAHEIEPLTGDIDPHVAAVAGALLAVAVLAGLLWRRYILRKRADRGRQPSAKAAAWQAGEEIAAQMGAAVESGEGGGKDGAEGTAAGDGEGESGSGGMGGHTPGERREAADGNGPEDADDPDDGEGAGEDDGRAGWLTRLRRRAAVALDRVRAGMAALFRYHPRTVAASFLLAFTQLLCRYSILPVVVVALAGPTNVFALYPLQGLLLIVSNLLLLPGGGGTVELGAGAVLALFLPAHLVGAAVLLWRLFTYHWNLFLGGGAFFLTLVRERRRLAA